MPRTVDNFVSLALRGYYDGTLLHRIIRNFMVQGGDPTGKGTGGESAWGGKFPDEFHASLKHSERGVLSMANAGPNTNGSQFFVTFKSASHLDRKHTVFGRLVGGADTLRAIETVHTSAGDVPTQPITVVRAEVFSDPFREWEEDTRAMRAPAGAGEHELDALRSSEEQPTASRAIVGSSSAPVAMAAPPRGGLLAALPPVVGAVRTVSATGASRGAVAGAKPSHTRQEESEEGASRLGDGEAKRARIA